MKHFRFVKILFVALLFQACEQSVCEIAVPTEVNFRICESLPTRSGKISFAIGDSIGIYAVKRVDANKPAVLSAQNNQAHNVKWVKTTKGWRPASPMDKVVWSQDGTPLDFYAYYPYQRDAIDPTAIILSVQKNQTDKQDLVSSDFLRATNLQGLTTGEVELKFTHLFAMLDVQLKRDGSSIAPDATLTASDVYTKISLNLGSGTQTPQETGHVQFLCSNPTVNMYQAILPAQNFVDGTPVLKIDEQGITYVYALKNVTLGSGSRQKFELNLK